VVDAPKGRRDEFVDPDFKRVKSDAIVVVLKAREPARIMIAIGDKTANRWHLELAQRWVIQYNVYINDARWGRMFVRMCLQWSRSPRSQPRSARFRLRVSSRSVFVAGRR
jgi:hypothetical protein